MNGKTSNQTATDGREQAYKLAKQLRSASRELARQFNSKKTRKQR